MPAEVMFGVGIPSLLRDAQRQENNRARELLRDPDSRESRQYLKDIHDRVEARMIARSIDR